MSKELIIINAIPNSEQKIKMLEEQLRYLKKLSMPIMIVSGCEVPTHISDQVKYVIVNTDNEVIDKDYSRIMYESGLHDLSYDHQQVGDYMCFFYWKTVNSTITKNIKLGFNAAKVLGYERVFYTEDDNIFKDGSFYYLNENMNAIRSGKYKMAGWIGNLPQGFPMMCTAFFFADVDWLLNNLTLPHHKDEWYDYDTTVKYHLHKPYEYVYYKLFEDKLDVFYNSQESYSKLEKSNTNNELMDFGKSNRRFNEKNLIDTFFTVLPIDNDPDKNKMLILTNYTHAYLPDGGKDYEIVIQFNDKKNHENTFKTLNLKRASWYYEILSADIDEVVLKINGYGVKHINCDKDYIGNNGHAIIEKLGN